MDLNFDTLPDSRALHHRFTFELLPRQFFKQTVLQWAVLRELSMGQKSIEEIWKIAAVMHKDLTYLDVEGLQLFYRDQDIIEIIEIQLPPVMYFPEASAIYLTHHPILKQYKYLVYIPEGDMAHWLEVDKMLEQTTRSRNLLKVADERLTELLKIIA